MKMTRLQLMHVATAMQNPLVVPRSPDPTTVGRYQGLQGALAQQEPATVRENEGASDAALRAERHERRVN